LRQVSPTHARPERREPARVNGLCGGSNCPRCVGFRGHSEPELRVMEAGRCWRVLAHPHDGRPLAATAFIGASVTALPRIGAYASVFARQRARRARSAAARRVAPSRCGTSPRYRAEARRSRCTAASPATPGNRARLPMGLGSHRRHLRPAGPTVKAEYRERENDPSTCETWNPPHTSYSAHNPTLTPHVALSTWHSEGLEAVSLADPLHPAKLAQFMPRPLGKVTFEDPRLSSDPDTGRNEKVVTVGSRTPPSRTPSTRRGARKSSDSCGRPPALPVFAARRQQERASPPEILRRDLVTHRAGRGPATCRRGGDCT
jgi:hypothetical protein